MKTLVDTKYLLVTWRSRPRPDGRKRKFKHSGHSVYVQIRGLEVVVWYR